MATKSGDTDKTLISGEMRQRNAWVWWKTSSHNRAQLSAMIFLVGWDAATSLTPLMLAGTSR